MIKQVSLEEIADIIMGQSPESSTYNEDENGLPFFQGKTDFSVQYPIVRKWCSAPLKIAEPNDILLSVRAPVGPTNICRVKSCIGRGLAAIRCRESADNIFLWFYLRSIEKKIADRGVGSTFTAIGKSEIAKIRVPVLSLPAQRKIASVLEKTEAAKEKRKEADRLTNEFLKSAFLEMFGDPVKNKKGWIKKKLGESDIKIIDGDRGKNYPKQQDFLDKGWCLFLNTKNVTEEGFKFGTTMFINKEKDRQLRKGKIQRNDIVLTTRGTVGNVALYDNSVPFDNVRINSGMVILRANLEKFNVVFLKALLNSNYFHNQKNRIVSGCAQPQLPIRHLKDMEVFIPPIVQQQKFADLVQKVEKLKEKQQESEKELDNLFNALMQKAFKEN